MDGRPLLACVLAGLLAGCQPPPPRQQLDARQVQLQAGRLSGLCAQGALLAELVRQRRVARAYPYVEQQAVAASAQQAIAELARPAGPQVADAQQRLLQVAVELQATVVRMADAQHDDAALQAIEATLRTLGMHAQQLGRRAA